MKTGSLRLQITLWLLIPLLGLLAFDAWLTDRRAMSAAHQAFDRTLAASLKSMREGISLRDGRVEVEIPNLALEVFDAEDGSRVYYQIRDERGTTITGYEGLPMPEGPVNSLYRTRFYDAEYLGVPVRMAAMPLPLHDVRSARTQMVWVLLAESTEPREQLASDILIGSLLQELMLISLALGIVWLGVRRGLLPLQRLSDAMSARGPDDLEPLEDTALPVEMKPLVAAVNQYVARLHRMIEGRKRFFADAAHQLKTPLAIIQAESELALREKDLPSVRAHVERLHGSVQQAAKEVAQLLSLSRLEPDSGYAPTLRRLRLDVLAQNVALEWAPLARRAGVDLGFEGRGPADIDGQTELLQELLGNLIDNAIRYAGAGAMVTVRVDGHRLAVEDNGPGVPAFERESIFKRFYRGESSASRDGSGLGLSIVREIARIHGAAVALESTPGGGLTVVVTFPAPVPALALASGPGPASTDSPGRAAESR
ncbi:sensor histidine kinase [Cupriavidus metallidurans]|uniref:sensor histidine kinase n=1 Tax=Cupriavidus metallidurans TaxID=119219 RepID=UPI001BFCC62E|nr:sensor histidine kinase [Cupriavidus metallidurans]QWC89965.1 sensor histidine kinase N-terminal domain-containing protein [Cupriavidus metallidurans]